MGLARLVLLDEESSATDAVMPDFQQVAESQPGAVGHQNPRSHQPGVRALDAADQPVSGVEQLMDLAMAPCHGARRWTLDSAERADYTLVHQAFLSGEGEESLEHPPVVVHRVRRQTVQGRCQVVVNLFWIEGLRCPWQSPDQDGQLLQIPGGTADAVDVPGGKFLEGHGGTVGNIVPPSRGVATPRQIRYNPHSAGEGQLAQLVRTPVPTILRALSFSLLAIAAWLPDYGAVLIVAGIRQLVPEQESLPMDGL